MWYTVCRSKSCERKKSDMLTRRFFLGGLASAFALGPRRIFSAPPGAFTGGKPLLSFGALSDVHICLAPGGEKLRDTYNTQTLEAAFTWFRDNGVDAVTIAGDMAHSGLAGELKALADTWFKVFPNDQAPDGRHVERVFVFGNHDWSSPGRASSTRSGRRSSRRRSTAIPSSARTGATAAATARAKSSRRA